MKGQLIAISGPAGVGKGTLVKLLLARNEDMTVSVSCTTRLPREGEIEGVSYFFLSKEAFEKKIAEGGFLEYDSHFGNYYGTPKDTVLERLREKNVILEIDVNGATSVKRNFPALKTVLIVPPSVEELKRRLIERNSETKESLSERLARVDYELSFADSYDHVIVNDDLETAYEELVRVIRSS
ncbi:MAG: guanylate kinase [Christensenellaceae bacterium]